MTIRVDGTVSRGGLRLQLDLCIEPGHTAVVGANGSGKTTLIRLLAGLEALDSGRLTFATTTIDEPSTSTFVQANERPIALAFQDHRVFPHMRAIDDVAFPLRRRGVDRHAARLTATEVLESVGLGDHKMARPHQLSGGQRQRVALARAIATPAEILLLDEPLASIDDSSRDALRTLLTEAAAPTVIWVTHHRSDADEADAVITIGPNGIRQTARR